MPFQYQWYVDKRVLTAEVSGDLDIDELTRSREGLLAMLNEGTPLVHLLVDDSKLGSIPMNLGQLVKMSASRPRSLGWVVLIGPGSRIPNFLIEMLSKIFRIHVRREPTHEKAVAFLQARDITVPWHEADESIASSS
jgi:hypothetical protein